MRRVIPTNVVIEMNRRGFSDFDIIRYLKGKGFTPVEINDAMNHAKIKLELDKNARDEDDSERIKVIADEKTEKLEEQTEQKIPISEKEKEMFNAILSRLKRIEENNKNHEKVLGEIKEQLPKIIHQQQSSIKTLNADVQALSQTFSKILEPLAHNVKVMSGMLDMPKEEKKAEQIEKEIKKEEKEIKSIELQEKPLVKPKARKPRKKTEKIIKKVTTITEIQESKSRKEKPHGKKKKSEPGLEDIF